MNPPVHMSMSDLLIAIGRDVGEIVAAVADWAVAHTTASTVLVAASALIGGLARLLLRWWLPRRWHARWVDGAMVVRVLPPPVVDPVGAVALWTHLLGLLRPARARLVTGQPHLSFEYAMTRDGAVITVWVPSGTSASQIARAITAAWPGSRTTITPAPPASAPTKLPTAGGDVVEGGVLRLARGHALPIADGAGGSDPVRAILAAPGPLGRGEWARVQVLARPISSARLARAVRTGSPDRRGLLSTAASSSLGLAAGIAAELLDLLAPRSMRVHRSRVNRRPGSSAGSAVRPSPIGDTATTARTLGESVGRGSSRLMTPRDRLISAAADRAAAAKANGGGYQTVVRYATGAPAPDPLDETGRSRAEAREVARAVVRRRAHALASAFALYSGHNHFRRVRLRRPAQVVAGHRFGRGDVLSVSELAALAHLPVDEHVPGLLRAGAATFAPPPSIASSGPSVKVLGDSDAVPGRPVGLTVADARHHIQIIGATGSGKSTLAAHLVRADAVAGRGSVTIDPKGDLVTDVLASLRGTPAASRVILIDPDRPQTRPGPAGRWSWPVLNPLAPIPGSAADRAAHGAAGDMAVEHVTAVFARLFASSWGPRTEDVLRVSCQTLRVGAALSSGLGGGGVPASLATVPALLTGPDTQRRALVPLHRLVASQRAGSRSNPGPGPRHERPVADRADVEELLRFWRWFAMLPDGSRAQTIAPLMNKLRTVLLRPFARHVLCGDTTAGEVVSTIDLSAVLDHGGVLLARLPKGTLGEDTTHLLGSLVLAQTWQAVTARTSTPPERRRDASILVDECHNFLHLPYRIEDMLAEARGHRVAITLAHQNLSQLPAHLRDGLSANARNKIVFAVSPEDAAVLARHTRPELSPHDLANLDAFHAAARLVVHGTETRAFTFASRPLDAPPPGVEPRHDLLPPAAPGTPRQSDPPTRQRVRCRPVDGRPPRSRPLRRSPSRSSGDDLAQHADPHTHR